jgi:hypothetical protein
MLEVLLTAGAFGVCVPVVTAGGQIVWVCF